MCVKRTRVNFADNELFKKHVNYFMGYREAVFSKNSFRYLSIV